MELIKRKNKLNQYKNSFPITFFNTKVVIVSGGFDPLHSGHISYINSAKKFGDYLIIALNSDEWLRQKKCHRLLEKRLLLLN